MILTLDIGNSRIKWGLWQRDELVANGAFDYSALTVAEDSMTALHEVGRPDAVMLACVAGRAVEGAVRDWLRARWNIEAGVLRTTKQFAGITHGYENPAQHGVDRWAALIAARALSQAPLCVISCGTAVTVDLVDAQGRHLGGQIMPGTRLMIEALGRRLPGLATLDVASLQPEAAIFAADTAAAVSSGVLRMQAAALDRACDDARSLLGAGMKTLVTGGGAAVIIPLMKNSVELQPELVLRGLYIASQAGSA